jgi:lipopolysaccharide/colanic/teichoic acid biosynthesis glycosyltransferase
MEIDSSGLRDLYQQTLTPDAEGLYKPGWWLGKSRDEEAIEESHVQPAIIDPKAARAFAMYSRQRTSFAWKNLPSYLVLLAWMTNTQFNKNMKRTFDLLIALSSLPLVLPILLLTAIAIKLDSPGPVIFKQERVGRWGSKFTCYKLRSMYADAESRKAELMVVNEADEVVFKMKNDPRVTRVGRFIRRLSIDELPQIFNVIKGDMSLVGPRPPVPIELESYPFDAFRRLEAMPGLTGLQQVSGRSELPFRRWVELDIEYIRDQSLKKDIEIILKTIPVAISGKGAY